VPGPLGPSRATEIEAGLRAYGLVSEIAEWRQALAD
jgi:hypothetical protein